MAARDLVIRPGDRVSLAGRYVARDDGDWLDLARTSDLMFHAPDWISHRSIQVIGLNAANVARDFGPDNDIIQGWARVTGRWSDNTILVEGQGTVPRMSSSDLFGSLHLACPPPLGGWDRSTSSMDVIDLESLRSTGAIVLDHWLREPGGALVLRIAAQDVDLVRRVIGPQLPRRLCVVASRFTAQDYHRAADTLLANLSEWDFEVASTEAFTSEGQPIIKGELLRVTDDIAEWADGLPDGLVHLRPIMTPA